MVSTMTQDAVRGAVSPAMLLARSIRTAAVASSLMLVLTWLLGLVVLPETATRVVIVEVLALPYWAFSFAPVKIVAAVNWLMGWSIPSPIVPPPYTFTYMRPSAPIGKELIASLVVWLIGSVLYGVAWHYVRPGSERRRKLVWSAAAAAHLAVAMRVPWHTYYGPGDVARAAEGVARVATVPSLILVDWFGEWDGLQQAVSCGAPLEAVVEGRGAYVWANMAWFLLVVATSVYLSGVRRRQQ